MIVPVPILKPGQVSCLITNDSKTPFTADLVFSNPKILPALVTLVIGTSGSKVGEDIMVKISGRDVSPTITRIVLPGFSVYAITRNRDISVSLETTSCDHLPDVEKAISSSEKRPVSNILDMQRAFETLDVPASLSLNDPIYKAMAESFHLGKKESK